ncbi:T9SS type A sorting domain-containing protein [Carboxylicivirga sp. A043]|uniref:T9SS type A sorting domain-containing protein n=1 Tax=Carboxylicivirga litoralis TaxID=2816963 RepID=UPI0021CB439A|nr:T9SS type A sorting domain-containing protein [Carboxylicivirga sp. A043]MCU4157864.1 T9SS type A sorting domain-containing protein [Carboxylicivirga sp. A043]
MISNKYKSLVLSLLLFFVINGSSEATLINYDFKDGNHKGISAENASLAVNSGELAVSISEANKAWKARLYLDVNQNIYSNPILYFRFKVGNIAADEQAGLAVTLKIDGVYNKASDAGMWRLYPVLDASTNDWQTLALDLTPLIESWEETNGTVHGNIQEVCVQIGTGIPYSGNIIFNNIKLGDVLLINEVQLNPENLKEILANINLPVTGSPNASNYAMKVDDIEHEVVSVSLRNDTTLAIQLATAIEIPREVKDAPSIQFFYNGNDAIKDKHNQRIEACEKMVSLSSYAKNLWKYWGEFDKVTWPYKDEWHTSDVIIDGWDWSLPDFVEADENAYIKYKNVPNLNFSCNNLVSVLVRWDELEPKEGIYNFELLRTRIKKASVGYDGVVLRLLSSVWEINSYPTPGKQIPLWLEERKNAPRWMDELDIAKIEMHKAIDGKYMITNMDIMDPDYHSRYLKFISELGKSGIPEIKELKLVNVCYRSASAGEEFTSYDASQNKIEALYNATEIEQRTKERLKVWADAFGDNKHKLMYVGHDEKAHVTYAAEMGIGTRNGFIEMYGATVHMPLFGLTINNNRYEEVDENNLFMQNKFPFGDENEEYSNEGRFGWEESFPYRYYITTFRMLQMRRNYVMHDGNTLNPELTWYLGMGLSRNVHSTPDAFSMLNEIYISPFANKNEDGSSNAGPVKNVERWLYQRDMPGYETTPCMAVPTAKDLWYADNSKPYDFTARKGKKMGFIVDDRLFSKGEQGMAIKVSYYDGVKGTLKLLYKNNNGIQEKSVVTTGKDKVKTATFFINAIMDDIGTGFNIELHSAEEVPVFFVRIIKTKQDNTSIDRTDTMEFSSIYPNPFDDHLRVKTSESKDASLVIYNLSGEIIYSTTRSNTMQINTSTWKTGVYLAKINDEEAVKLIKK